MLPSATDGNKLVLLPVTGNVFGNTFLVHKCTLLNFNEMLMWFKINNLQLIDRSFTKLGTLSAKLSAGSSAPRFLAKPDRGMRVPVGRSTLNRATRSLHIGNIEQRALPALVRLSKTPELLCDGASSEH